MIVLAIASATITTTAASAAPQAPTAPKGAAAPLAPAAIVAQGNCVAGYSMNQAGTPYAIVTAPYKNYPICGTGSAPWPVAGCFTTPVQVVADGSTITLSYQFCTHSSRG